MILLVDICREPLHSLEFVRPVEQCIKDAGMTAVSVKYLDLSEVEIEKFSHIIICGTGLMDEEYLNHLDVFDWIPAYEGQLLGICGGMEIIGRVLGGTLQEGVEIGLKRVSIKESFFGITGDIEVYELHRFCIAEGPFEVIAESEVCPQIIKYQNRNIFGVMFHPEVRNKELILGFIQSKEK